MSHDSRSSIIVGSLSYFPLVVRLSIIIIIIAMFAFQFNANAPQFTSTIILCIPKTFLVHISSYSFYINIENKAINNSVL